MSDHLGHVEVPTNGTRKVTDAEPPKASDQAPASFVDGPSVDERLDALMETIRTWDWRAASVEAGPPPADAATSTVSPVHDDNPPPRFVRILEPLRRDPSTVRTRRTRRGVRESQSCRRRPPEGRSRGAGHPNDGWRGRQTDRHAGAGPQRSAGARHPAGRARADASSRHG